jgi:hypothetical protein
MDKNSRTLIGLALPYNCRSTRPVAAGLHETIRGGAVTPSALDGRGMIFTLNHGTRVDGAIVSLVNKYSGVYGIVTLPDNQQGRDVLAMRSRWTGLSIEFERTTINSSVDWASCTQTVYYLNGLTGISLCLDAPPVYKTWIEPRSQAAFDRVAAENHAALVRLYGSDYKTSKPDYFWAPPQQCARIEGKLESSEPGRAIYFRFAAVGTPPGSW